MTKRKCKQCGETDQIKFPKRGSFCKHCIKIKNSERYQSIKNGNFITKIKLTLLERFNEKYEINPITNCWDWIAGKSPKHGTFHTKENHRASAHRVSYELFIGEIPESGKVCHSCNNSYCVNPEHLYIGVPIYQKSTKPLKQHYCLDCGETNPIKFNYSKCCCKKCTSVKNKNNYIKKIPKTKLERFNKKYIIDSITECWEWQGSKSKDGYGIIIVNNKPHRAHRVSYELFKENIPDDLFICHHCDNPSCVNPEHLFAGTHQDNMDDMVQKGRSPKQHGEDSSRNVLTEEQAQYILDFTHYKGSLTLLATKFNVHVSTIFYVKNGKSWSHLKKSSKNNRQ